MLAVRLDHPVGIDVEELRELPPPRRTLRSAFSRQRKTGCWRVCPKRRDAFFVLWTHKEAMVKGPGLSLAANLGPVEFDFDPVAGPKLLGWEDRTIAQNWCIRRLDPAPGYVAAVATGHPVRSLALRNWNPLGAD